MSTTDPVGSKRTGSRLWVPLMAGLAAVGLAAGAAVLVLMWRPDPGSALAGLRSARPWFVGLQLLALGLAWTYWATLVAKLSRWRGWPPAAEEALLQGKHRIFLLLGATEALILFRALT